MERRTEMTKATQNCGSRIGRIASLIPAKIAAHQFARFIFIASAIPLSVDGCWMAGPRLETVTESKTFGECAGAPMKIVEQDGGRVFRQECLGITARAPGSELALLSLEPRKIRDEDAYTWIFVDTETLNNITFVVTQVDRYSEVQFMAFVDGLRRSQANRAAEQELSFEVKKVQTVWDEDEHTGSIELSVDGIPFVARVVLQRGESTNSDVLTIMMVNGYSWASARSLTQSLAFVYGE